MGPRITTASGEELIEVDRVLADDAPVVAKRLRQAGLHPVYDKRPRLARYPRLPIYTPFYASIYVSRNELQAAARIIAEYQQRGADRIDRITRGWWMDLLGYGVIVLPAGLAGWYLSGETGTGVLMGLIALFLTWQLLAGRKRIRQSSAVNEQDP